MDVIDMRGEIVRIGDDMLPATVLPDAALAFPMPRSQVGFRG